MANAKTNAMRILERAGISYKCYIYECEGEFSDGVTAAAKLGQPAEKVFKTLVAQGMSKEYHVFVIPVAEELDLKAAARAAGEKAVEMIKVADINKVTGYVRGGCSPIGMKKEYKTILDASAEGLDTIIVSGGKIGVQIELTPEDLVKASHCTAWEITAKR